METYPNGRSSLLLIYTGGTIGMKEDLKDQTLKSQAQQWKDKNCQTFRQFYALV